MEPTLKTYIENAFAAKLASLLESGAIDMDGAGEMSSDFLEMIDGYRDLDSFYEAFSFFIERYPACTDLAEIYVAQQDEQDNQRSIDTIQQKIKEMQSLQASLPPTP